MNAVRLFLLVFFATIAAVVGIYVGFTFVAGQLARIRNPWAIPAIVVALVTVAVIAALTDNGADRPNRSRDGR